MVVGYNRVRFAEYEADLRSGEVFRNGVQVPLQEKPFQILRLLLLANGEVVDREHIYAAVWPDTHVEASLSLNTAMRKLRTALRDEARNPQLIETVDSGYRLLVEPRFLPVPRTVRTRLAVAPLENLGSEDQEYLAEGMTEEMISHLGRTHKDISIIAPFSMLCYKRLRRTIAEIAHDMRADYVLAGSVLLRSNNVQVMAKLVRSKDQACIWSESYTRNADDLFQIQDEITGRIAEAILSVLHVPEIRSITDRWTHEKYLKGCFFANKWSEPGFRKAIELFQQTIEEDPGFAPAHAALAKLYMGMGAQGVLPPSAINDLAQQAATRALSLDPGLADAITALGWSQLFFHGDWHSAERSFSRSMNINPSATHAYEGYAHLLVAVRRFDEAIEVAHRACELDPLSPFAGNLLACTYYFVRRFEEARTHILSCLEANPGFPIAYATLGWVCQALGETGNSVEAHRNSVQHNGGSPAMLADLARALALDGHAEEAQRTLDQAIAAREKMYVPPYWIAQACVGLGQHDAALDWLEKGIDERCGWRVFYGVDPKLEAVASHERFRTMLDRIGFPQAAT